jgi:hypothetical protein
MSTPQTLLLELIRHLEHQGKRANQREVAGRLGWDTRRLARMLGRSSLSVGEVMDAMRRWEHSGFSPIEVRLSADGLRVSALAGKRHTRQAPNVPGGGRRSSMIHPGVRRERRSRRAARWCRSWMNVDPGSGASD